MYHAFVYWSELLFGWKTLLFNKDMKTNRCFTAACIVCMYIYLVIYEEDYLAEMLKSNLEKLLVAFPS